MDSTGIHGKTYKVIIGVRQGCILSPILCCVFVNDLAAKLKAIGIGVEIGKEEQICIMLYAHD